jgi:hypothetical protein
MRAMHGLKRKIIGFPDDKFSAATHNFRAVMTCSFRLGRRDEIIRSGPAAVTDSHRSTPAYVDDSSNFIAIGRRKTFWRTVYLHGNCKLKVKVSHLLAQDPLILSGRYYPADLIVPIQPRHGSSY